MKNGKEMYAETILQVIDENGFFPNNAKLPVLLYKKSVDALDLKPQMFEEIFTRNGWTNCWRDGIYDFHHYHSNTHEVLGVYRGSCHVQMGGENGPIFRLEKADVLIIPSGVSHKNVGCSRDFKCVGAYPFDISYDMNYGTPEEKALAMENIQKTPLPQKDPVYGEEGPLFKAWKITRVNK